MYKFLINLTENEHLAEDLTQDVFVKIIRNIDKFDVHGKAKFSTYAVTIAKNSFIDYLRKEKKFLLSQSLDNISTVEPFAFGFEESLLDRVYVENVMEQMENLTDEQKIVIK